MSKIFDNGVFRDMTPEEEIIYNDESAEALSDMDILRADVDFLLMMAGDGGFDLF